MKTGEVPERLIGTVSKTVVVLVATEGSNPSLSAGAAVLRVPLDGIGGLKRGVWQS